MAKKLHCIIMIYRAPKYTCGVQFVYDQNLDEPHHSYFCFLEKTHSTRAHAHKKLITQQHTTQNLLLFYILLKKVSSESVAIFISFKTIVLTTRRCNSSHYFRLTKM